MRAMPALRKNVNQPIGGSALPLLLVTPWLLLIKCSTVWPWLTTRRLYQSMRWPRREDKLSCSWFTINLLASSLALAVVPAAGALAVGADFCALVALAGALAGLRVAVLVAVFDIVTYLVLGCMR